MLMGANQSICLFHEVEMSLCEDEHEMSRELLNLLACDDIVRRSSKGEQNA